MDWPALEYAEIRPTIDHLHRLTQIAGKYTLEQPFEWNWGNAILPVTPRGFRTPLLRAPGTLFALDYDLVAGRLGIETPAATESLPLGAGSVAGLLERFRAAGERLGLPPLGSLSQPEIPGAPPLDEDREERPYDPDAARRVAAALSLTAAALGEWQAPYRGFRPRVGLMWGAFDLAATRYNGRLVTPPAEYPVFQQNGMNGEVVAVGLTFGDPFHGEEPALYAYVAPPPESLKGWDFAGGRWVPEHGLIVLEWETVRASADPHAATVAFADAVYRAAVELGSWPDDLEGPRVDSWTATREPVG